MGSFSFYVVSKVAHGAKINGDLGEAVEELPVKRSEGLEGVGVVHSRLTQRPAAICPFLHLHMYSRWKLDFDFSQLGNEFGFLKSYKP